LDLKLVPVHFRGDAEGITNILGGHVQAYTGAGGHVAQVRAGKLRTLLQMMGEPADADPKSVARLKDVLPDAPRQIVEFPYCIIAPKGIPEPVKKILHDAFKKGTVDDPDFVKTARTVNLEVQYQDPKDLQVKLRDAHALIGKMMKELGLERK
jgi:tripartite-type tricarboxylate transporter receptor subunit TctC